MERPADLNQLRQTVEVVVNLAYLANHTFDGQDRARYLALLMEQCKKLVEQSEAIESNCP